MTFRSIASALLTASLFACGGKPDTTVSHNRSGTGSSTLKVTGVIDGVPGNGSYSTDLRVSVRDVLGNKISGATVAIYNSEWGTVTLAEAGTQSGDYVGLRSTFPAGDFALAVTRGSDNVGGVVAGNPGAFGINGPKQGAVVPVNQPVQLSWTTPLQAKAATIQTNQYTAAGPDTGSFTIPAANNPADANQSLTIARYNDVDIAGGLVGSTLRVTVESSVGYVVR
jgi:hypothetical protein